MGECIICFLFYFIPQILDLKVEHEQLVEKTFRLLFFLRVLFFKLIRIVAVIAMLVSWLDDDTEHDSRHLGILTVDTRGEKGNWLLTWLDSGKSILPFKGRTLDFALTEGWQ